MLSTTIYQDIGEIKRWLCVLWLLGGTGMLWGAKTTVIDFEVYHNSLGSYQTNLTDVFWTLSPSFEWVSHQLPSAKHFAQPLENPAAFPLKTDEQKWLYAGFFNELDLPITIVLYFSADQIQFFQVSSSSPARIDTAWAGDKISLDQLVTNTPPFQGSHLSRESLFLRIQPKDTLHLYALCGPMLQKAEMKLLALSNEAYYFQTFAQTKHTQLNVFWIMQGVFWFMVLFSFFMFLINHDRAYLYFSLYALVLGMYLILTVPTDAWLNFGNHPKLQGIFFNLTAYGIPGMYGLFTIAFVHSDGWQPRLRTIIEWVLKGTLICCIGSSLILPWLPVNAMWYSLIFWIYLPTSACFGVIAVYALYLYFQADKALIRYYAFASLFLVGGGLLVFIGNLIFGSNGDISNFTNLSILLAFEAGGALQLLTFALCLSYRGRLIEQEKNQLAAIDQVKSRFFANISHEFRTPLTLILGPSQQLWEQQKEGAEKEQLDLVRRNARRLLRLVNQILDLARLESGRMEVENEPGDLIGFLRRVSMNFDSLAISQDIQFSFRSDLDKLHTRFDPDKVEKILVNLLSNAFKYTPEGGKIEVSVRQDRSQEVWIEVVDNGAGIPATHLPHIFERFYQAESSNYTTDQPSTGIGLALTKELVEILGGSIEVQSEEGAGTRFSFRLPIQRREENEQIEQPMPAEMAEFSQSSPNSSKSGTNTSILLIEDNADIRAYLRSSLADQYQLIEAEDGEIGIAKAKEQIPDLIITDVMMPRKDGFMVTRELKAAETTDHIPIIILTGKSSLESKIEGLETDADEYLTKPFEAKELLVRIQNLLRNRKRLQERFSKQILWGEGNQLPARSQEELFLQKAVQLIESRLGEESFSVEQFAEALHMDRTQLFRKLKALTDLSPSRFVRSVRLRHARQLIEGSDKTISEIAFDVGFSSPTYFNRVFKEEYGKAPGAFRLKGDGLID